MEKQKLFEKFIGLLNEIRTSEESELGLSFFLGFRITLLSPEERAGLKIEDPEEFLDIRIAKFIDAEERYLIHQRVKSNPNINEFIMDAIGVFKWLGAKLEFKLSKNRLAIDGNKTDLFTPYKPGDFEDGFEPVKDLNLNNVGDVYETFFYQLGARLKKHNVINSSKEAFVFSYYFGQFANEYDQDGIKDFFIIFNNLIPPLYNSLFEPEKFEFFADNKDGKKYLPFHYALTNLIGNVEAGRVIWNEQRLIFHDQKTGKFRNDDFQFLPLNESRPFFEMLLRTRYLTKDGLEHFKEQSKLFDNKLHKLKKYKKTKDIDFIDHVFNKVKEFWGFDVNRAKEITTHANINFFAITFICFIYCYVANIDDFNPVD